MKKYLFWFLSCCFISTTFAASKHLQKLTVMLDWLPNPDHAPLIIAMQQGFFKAQGLEVKLINPSASTDSPKWVANNKADIGLTYEPEFMEQVDQGLPLIRVGTLIDKPLDCLVTLNDSKVRSLSDLKGKMIGSNTGAGLSSVMLKVMLAKQGLNEKDVDLINIHNNLSQALLSHKVDAVSGMMRNFEVPQMEANGHLVNAFFPEDNGIPNYSELIFITNQKNVHDKRFPRFLEAIRQAVAYLDEHPRETWKAFTKAYPEANNTVNREAWFTTMPYFAEDPADFDKTEWEQFSQFMHQNHLIKTVQPVSRYAVMIG